jgi:F-type H+-transporting ATPase subunit gamma
MTGIREIRRRIRAVRNIEQITKAMKMVAAARLRKAQERVLAARPYADKMDHVMTHLAAAVRQVEHPLVGERDEVKRIAAIVIGGNRGLCGSYNTNLFRSAAHFVRSKGPVPVTLVLYGARTRPHFRRRGYDILAEPDLPDERLPAADVRAVSRELQRLYVAGEVDEVYLVYTEFVSALRQRSQVRRILPLGAGDADKDGGEPGMGYIFEPDPEQLLGALLPRYVDTQIYQALLESMASEQGARMTAMSNAVDKSGDMIRDLTLAYNKARQASITKELLEVVSGAEALK